MQTLATTQQGPGSEDAILASQLTSAFKLADNAMTHVVRFGAMMWMLEHKLFACEQFPKGGRGKKGGVSEWLRIHAPEINKHKAFRFLHVAQSVAGKFELPKKISFAELASKPAADLPKALQKKQLELWDFVNGTSQRSWLDQFTPKGGSRERPNGTKRRTKAEKEFDDKAGQALDWYRFGFAGIKLAFQDPENTWHHLDDEHLANLADLVKRFSKSVDEVCRARKVVPVKLANWHLEGEEQI